MLHTVTMATAPNGKRPAKPEDVTSLSLIGTKVTGVGLKEIAGFKNLTTLNLPSSEVNDEVLAALREVNLLHALGVATGEKGKGATKPGEVFALDLARSKVSDTELKELAGLENLAELKLRGSKVTPAGVKALQKMLPKCKIQPVEP